MEQKWGTKQIVDYAVPFSSRLTEVLDPVPFLSANGFHLPYYMKCYIHLITLNF